MYQAYTEQRVALHSRGNSQVMTPHGQGGGGTSRYTAGYNSTSEDGNKELFNQMMHNILETINQVCTQLNITDDEAFEKIFFDWEKENVIRDKLADANSAEITIKEFTSQYAQQLLNYNNAYLEMKELREKLLQTVGNLETTKYRKGQKYHFIDPTVADSRLVCSIIQVIGLENAPQVKIYLYVDDEFAYKSRAYPKNSNPNINLDIDILMPNDSKKIVLEIYDAQDSDGIGEESMSRSNISEVEEDDDDKVFYTKIGRTELPIDKILTNLLIQETEYITTRNIIACDTTYNGEESEDDVFSSNSLFIKGQGNDLIQTKGRIQLVFNAELMEDFVERVDKVKRVQIIETQERIELLHQAIDQKNKIIKQAISCLHHITFENERGLVLDQLPMMMYNSIIDEGSSMMSDRPKSVLRMSNNQVSRMIEEDRTPHRLSKEEKEKMRLRNKKEIEQFERSKMNKGNQRMCGCDSMCFIF